MRFGIAVAVGRGIRYFGQGYLAVLYGEQAAEFMKAHGAAIGIGLALTAVLMATVYSCCEDVVMDLLPFNAVHVDLVHPDDPAAWSQHEAYRALLSPEEHERMARLVFERDRRRFLLTRALVRTMLSRYAGVAPAEWAFIANVHGRPEILDRPRGVPDLRFNLSHTEGLIACAVTIGREVGVDVEHIQRRLTQDVAGRFFAPQ